MQFIKPYSGLPKSLPYMQVAHYCKAAREVGGDFLYHRHINDRESVLILGDVSGKGLLASYHTDELTRCFERQFNEGLSMGEFIIETNRFIARRFDKHIFVSLFYLHVNSEDQVISYARAGQCPPIFYSEMIENSFYLHDKGIALGFIRNDSVINDIEISEREYDSGDILFIYSDGIVENVSPVSKEEYGYQRLMSCFNTLDKEAHPDLLLQAVLREHEHYIGSKKMDDDTTLMILKFM